MLGPFVGTLGAEDVLGGWPGWRLSTEDVDVILDVKGVGVELPLTAAIGISPDLGVLEVSVSRLGVSTAFCFRNALVSGESCLARWDFRLCFSMSDTAQPSRSTGVLFAA
jgi:hypothetical protein